MSEYIAIAAYVGVTFVVFIGALAWNMFRKAIKRRLNMEDYHTPPSAHHPPAHQN